MNKLCTLAGATLVGWAGWLVGEAVGFELMGCFVLSSIGSVVGVWLGWKLARRWS